MADKRVIVTYCDDAQIWTHLSEELSNRLPLRNMSWQGIPSRNTTISSATSAISTSSPLPSPLSDRPPTTLAASNSNLHHPSSSAPDRDKMSASRPIDMLDIELKKFSQDVFPKEGPITLNPSTIFCHMYLVSCEDAELYKATVKKQIQDWVNLVTSKRNQEYMIVYLPGPSEKRSSRFLTVGSSVFDKIKADFNTKRDRVAQLKLFQPGLSDLEIWGDFFNKMKETILAGFTLQLVQRDEDTKRLETQRHLPGWNYNQYFILKESLSNMFEVMTIYDAALQCYDELEALFTQMQNQGAAWFKAFGGTDIGDDSEDIFNLKRKPYRDLILQTNCTIFDFRIYLFGRQCQMLVKLNMPTEICQRAKVFISMFSRTLREYQTSLIPHFAEVWIYSTCLHIVSHCEEVLAVAKQNSVALDLYEAAKADLLHYAWCQLDSLGGLAGLIAPHTLSSPASASKAGAASLSVTDITNEELKSALQSEQLFDDLYLNLSARAAKCFELGHRPRQSMMLHNDAANLHFHRKRYLEASKEWESIVFKYSAAGWVSIDTILLEKLSTCQEELGQKTQLVQSCLHILSHPSAISTEKLSSFVNKLQKVSKEMDGPILRDSDTLFQVSVMGLVVKVGDEDGLNVEINIHSTLPKEVLLDKASLCMVGGEMNEDVILTRLDVLIKPGSNVIRVSSEKTSVPGSYAVENVKLNIGQVTFSYNLLKDNRKHVFKILEHATSLRLTVSLPDQLVYGEPVSVVQMRIYSRQTAFESGTITCSSLSGLLILPPKSVTFRIFSALDDRHSDPVREQTRETIDGRIQVPSCGENDVIEFLVPFSIPPPSQMTSPIGRVDPRTNELEHLIKITMPYTTSDSRRRIYSAVERVKMGIPFLIGHSVMESEKGLHVSVGAVGGREIPTRLVSSQMVAPPSFSVKEYFTASNQVEAFIISQLENYLHNHSAAQYIGFLTQYLRDRVLHRLDYASYAILDSMPFVEYDKAGLAMSLSSEDADVREKLLDLVDDFQESHRTIDMAAVRDSVKMLPKTIIYNVYLPSSQILLTADLGLCGSQTNFVIGDIIPCKLTISESRWPAGTSLQAIEVVCEAVVQNDLWMFSGKKRRILTLEQGKGFTSMISLIPLKNGMLPLPTFQISPFRVNGEPVNYDTPPIAQIHFFGARQVSVIPPSSSQQIFVSDEPSFVKGSVQSWKFLS
ncbi:hypothetical protein SmJEL517_g04249 [Synchytrium microbalum]|uniref:Trafficking protein particle complex subunit 11 domain-containing protein n=1 Tax=Synchytrium microbalum TaxID=1806994 RepID=A0A507C422_9FUNG|nr:uncharacterized protein SmJEL517_g04249 [Synchytrium microbalum]TPX32716.1 hypothetical protein SmJEL517_g04249 [Synchytrium microbalum]